MQNEKRVISLPCNHTFRDPGGGRVGCPVCGKMYTRNGNEFREIRGLNFFADTSGPQV
jgi:hypothetical protein